MSAVRRRKASSTTANQNKAYLRLPKQKPLPQGKSRIDFLPDDILLHIYKYKHLKNQYWSRVFKVERESDLTEAKYSLQHDVANAIMNIELIEIEYQIESEVIFNPDLI